ncbi:hypothetical protein BGW38_005660 [Lunasporangiospora selenospora]|uniref:VPS9 domain-containing protein n=1 Tax=Lunasporangiospora selenospora TaxID=979761 RepID=A0A9P6KH32_9FUNG|nr:hypothetical protein BGW38_005660 [Lunasporangiospora selenospora]
MATDRSQKDSNTTQAGGDSSKIAPDPSQTVDQTPNKESAASPSGATTSSPPAMTTTTLAPPPVRIDDGVKENDVDLLDDNENSSQIPTLTRRKSSLSTLESRLKRASSMDKHVTIVDVATGDVTVPTSDSVIESKGEDSPSAEETAKDEENIKELTKILKQFDPLERSESPKEGKGSEAMAGNSKAQSTDIDSETSAAPSPEISLSLSSSPRTPQQLNSPQTSYDVQMAMSEKAKKAATPSPLTTTKKKSESRQKSSEKSLEKSDPGSNSSKSASQSKQRSSEQSPKPKDVPFDFQKFLEQMRHKNALPITRYFQSFLKEFDKKPWTVNEQIKIIHDFLDFIIGKMALCDPWRNVSDQEFENAKEGMEKLVMNRLFAHTFSPSTTDDAERDEVLAQKIRIFRWVEEKHLDIPHSSNNETFLKSAQSELRKMNSFRAPRDKVICILNCCKFIFTLIRRSEGNSKGADTFLPILIYVVLKANPPNLVSNVQFRNPDKLQAEAGYYLASLMGAISFIENLEVSSLSISAEEFDRQIEATMLELSREKAEAAEAEAAAAAAAAAQSPGRSRQNNSSTDSAAMTPTSGAGNKKQESRLVTMIAGTALSRNNTEKGQRKKEASQINEKQYLVAENPPPDSSSRSSSNASPALSTGSTSSILNPVALIGRGANFAVRTVQKPFDLIEKIFQDSGSDQDENANRAYPGQFQQHQQQLHQQQLQQQQQQQQQQQRPNLGDREGSFTEFMYVPSGGQLQQPSPQQPRFTAQQPPLLAGQGGAPPMSPQQITIEYSKALETLTDMFPTCERQVCEVILQANDGRLSPSIDALLEISSANESKSDQGQEIVAILDPTPPPFETLQSPPPLPRRRVLEEPRDTPDQTGADERS